MLALGLLVVVVVLALTSCGGPAWSSTTATPVAERPPNCQLSSNRRMGMDSTSWWILGHRDDIRTVKFYPKIGGTWPQWVEGIEWGDNTWRVTRGPSSWTLALHLDIRTTSDEGVEQINVQPPIYFGRHAQCTFMDFDTELMAIAPEYSWALEDAWKEEAAATHGWNR